MVRLRWADNSTNERGFEIQRRKLISGAPWRTIGRVAGGVVTFSDRRVTCLTTCRSRVRDFNADGKSAYSNALRVTTH